jgi:hypothetical protein
MNGRSQLHAMSGRYPGDAEVYRLSYRIRLALIAMRVLDLGVGKMINTLLLLVHRSYLNRRWRHRILVGEETTDLLPLDL